MKLTVKRPHRRPTMIPTRAIPRHNPADTRSLGETMWLEDTRRGERFELVAGNATGGLLRLAGRTRVPTAGQRLTLLGGRLAPVRFVVQVDGLVIRAGEQMLSVRWVVLSGPGTGSELQGILRTVLGVNAAVDDLAATKRSKCTSELAPKARRLVYQAERKTLRSMSVAAPLVNPRA